MLVWQLTCTETLLLQRIRTSRLDKSNRRNGISRERKARLTAFVKIQTGFITFFKKGNLEVKLVLNTYAPKTCHSG